MGIRITVYPQYLQIHKHTKITLNMKIFLLSCLWSHLHNTHINNVNRALGEHEPAGMCCLESQQCQECKLCFSVSHWLLGFKREEKVFESSGRQPGAKRAWQTTLNLKQNHSVEPTGCDIKPEPEKHKQTRTKKDPADEKCATQITTIRLDAYLTTKYFCFKSVYMAMH